MALTLSVPLKSPSWLLFGHIWTWSDQSYETFNLTAYDDMIGHKDTVQYYLL